MAGAVKYEDIEPPASGEALVVAPGVKWVRLALPFPPEHINVWLVDDRDGWAIVDTGLARDDAKLAWEAVFATQLEGRPITRVICTHFHPDHMGLASWLCRRWNVELWTTLGEYYTARAVHAQGSPEDVASKVAFYRSNGVGTDGIGQFATPENLYRRGVPDLPAQYRRISGGVPVRVGDVAWTPIIGRGHCPEHACLWARDLGVLIGGDIVLPRITPNIGVWPAEPFADPLRDYLASLDGFAAVPEDTLILPAHGQPYRGVNARIADIRAHHESRLSILIDAAKATPAGLRAVDCFKLLFRREIGPGNIGLATGEALAHLHLLESRGGFARTRDSDGVWRFVAV
jgi:glyoxylase-like metal-dependent hydrolase (beta-lactamase superfamily II)